MKAIDMRIATIPMGMLIKNTQCQDQLSVIQPPSRGPTMGPIMMPIPKIAMAVPCWCRGKVSRRIACEMGCSDPPESPWMTRKKMRARRLQEAPQRKELTVNRTMENSRKRLRPKSRPSHPVMGMTTALAAR